MNKRCGSCKQEKDVASFGPNSARKDGLQAQCRDCKKAMQGRWYAKNKACHIAHVNQRRKQRAIEKQYLLFQYLYQHPCVDCTESDPLMLEFDHVRGQKRSEISQMVADGLAWNTILAEIEKCDVRCVRCHRLKTMRQFQYTKVSFVVPDR